MCFGGGHSGCAGVETSSSPVSDSFVSDSEDIGRRCPVNLYGSDQVRDRLNGEIVDYYSPLGLLVLCVRQARLVSLYMHHRHVFHEAALIYQFSNCYSISVASLPKRGLLFLDLTSIALWTTD